MRCRCIWQTCKYEMHNIVGEIMFSIGDENFLPKYLICTITQGLGFRLNGIKVGACLRLRKVHGAHPLTGDKLFKINVFKHIRAMNI